jgi:hypothetical protein
LKNGVNPLRKLPNDAYKYPSPTKMGLINFRIDSTAVKLVGSNQRERMLGLQASFGEEMYASTRIAHKLYQVVGSVG